MRRDVYFKWPDPQLIARFFFAGDVTELNWGPPVRLGNVRFCSKWEDWGQFGGTTDRNHRHLCGRGFSPCLVCCHCALCCSRTEESVSSICSCHHHSGQKRAGRFTSEIGHSCRYWKWRWTNSESFILFLFTIQWFKACYDLLLAPKYPDSRV